MIQEPPTRYRLVPLLSPAEENVLCAVLAGHTTRAALAVVLGISPITVRTHLMAIRNKIFAHNMADIVLWAWRNGYALPDVVNPPASSGIGR